MAPLYAQRRVQAFLKRKKKLQTVLGELNDAALVRSMLADAGLAQAGEAVSERAIGWAMGASQARAESAWAGAKALWKDVEKGKTFWR
jgi:CHAD domain-containing protein